MPRHTHGDAMPPQLRSAAIQFAVETVGYLREILQYSAPAYAKHGWARMCMYRTADAMDTIGLLVDAIAAHLARGGAEPEMIRRLLEADRERLRTARPGRALKRYAKEDLHVMPEWIADQMRDSLAFVILRLPVVLRSAVRVGDPRWAGRCLRPMVDSMDQLGRLANLFATVHVDVLNEHMLARYQQLFQQQPRSGMPYEDDGDYLDMADWGEELVGPDWYEVKLLTLLAMLDERCEGQWWEVGGGELRPDVRNAAMATLNGLEVAMMGEGYDPRRRLTSGEWVYAEAVAAALRDRLASDFQDASDRGRPLLDVLRAALDRSIAGSDR
ncbi:hypothetical protein [Kitasatospora purpeofusca]|uniref:hypothetical protein n=1 Tax=Kitasatospora purpeofusca TaxID=67352 RepID=UPI0036D23B68